MMTTLDGWRDDGLGVASREDIRAALLRLGIDRLVLSIHQVSFPGGSNDLGCGTPYSGRGQDFLRFIARLGFTGVALGPAGITSLSNPSPYDSTLFSTNPMFVDPGDDAPEVHPGEVDGTGQVSRVDYARAWTSSRALLRSLWERAMAEDPSGTASRFARFRDVSPWLEREAAYEACALVHGEDWRTWPASTRELLLCAPGTSGGAGAGAGAGASPDAFSFAQLVLSEQHARMREVARFERLCLYADAQIGVSHRDRFLFGRLFLPDYLMGAPPSRTNPAGQPWGYPVLDPALCHGPDSSGGQFFRWRIERLFSGHDGLRIDHPHGWICPWVYRPDADHDQNMAVQRGARLHESPDLDDHPLLSQYALVRGQQLDRTLPRYHERWVKTLDEAQIEAFAAPFGALMDLANEHGVERGDLLVEVLSTCPHPLQAVLARFGLGQFRVTQKARVDDPSDVYRSDNAKSADWIMAGNHDTPPLSRVVASWSVEERRRRAHWLLARLGTARTSSSNADALDALTGRLAGDVSGLRDAMVAELFVAPARNVQIFWADLFGVEEQYNRPGEVHPDNWSLRVPSDFERFLAQATADRRAPRLGRALALALRSLGDEESHALARRLDPTDLGVC